MANPFISVVIPVYKVDMDLFSKCLSSILAQSFTDYEIVIVLDGAPEDVETGICAMTKQDERVRIIRQENAGVSAARNRGIAEAEGKYICFVDADDYLLPDNFAAAKSWVDNLSSEPEVLIWGAYKCYGERRVEFTPYLEDVPRLSSEQIHEGMQKCLVGTLPFFKYPCSKDVTCAPWGRLYLRSFLQREHLTFPEGVCRAEDMTFNLKVFSCAQNISYMHRFFYCYRQVADSATYVYRDGGIRVFTDALCAIRKHLDAIGTDDLTMQIYYMRCIFFFLESMDMDYLHADNPHSFSEKRAQMKAVLDTEPYKEAVSKLSYRHLTLPRKIPLFLMRNRMMALLMLFYNVFRKLK